jgi:hypothetical protein
VSDYYPDFTEAFGVEALGEVRNCSLGGTNEGLTLGKVLDRVAGDGHFAEKHQIGTLGGG